MTILPSLFVAKELIFKIDNILTRQQNTALTNATEPAKEKITFTSERDKLFCKRLEDILAEHYTDSNFNVEALVSKIALSERQLQRKLKAIFEQSPAEYIRYYRLLKAKELLLTGKSISFVSDNVGFNSASYFSRSFKAVFNLSPKAFIAQTTT